MGNWALYFFFFCIAWSAAYPQAFLWIDFFRFPFSLLFLFPSHLFSSLTSYLSLGSSGLDPPALATGWNRVMSLDWRSELPACLRLSGLLVASFTFLRLLLHDDGRTGHSLVWDERLGVMWTS